MLSFKRNKVFKTVHFRCPVCGKRSKRKASSFSYGVYVNLINKNELLCLVCEAEDYHEPDGLE